MKKLDDIIKIQWIDDAIVQGYVREIYKTWLCYTNASYDAYKLKSIG